MNPLPIVSPGLVESLGRTLLHSVWQLAAIAGLFGIAMRLLANHSCHFRYLVGCFAMATMIAVAVTEYCLFSFTPRRLMMGASSMSLVPDQTHGLQDTAHLSGRVTPEAHNKDSARTSKQTSQNIALSRSAVADTSAFVRFVSPWLAGFWAVGVVSLCIWHFGGWLTIQRIKHQSSEVIDRSMRQLVERLAKTIHVTPPRLAESCSLDGPCILGWIRPAVLIPIGLLTGLSTTQLEAILAHELAHVRRYDYLANVLQSVAETLLFYHPAVWWVSRSIRLEREYCADAIAVGACGSSTSYSAALVALEEFCQSERHPKLAVAGHAGLEQRILRILRLSSRDVSPIQASSWCGAALLSLLLMGGMFAATPGGPLLADDVFVAHTGIDLANSNSSQLELGWPLTLSWLAPVGRSGWSVAPVAQGTMIYVGCTGDGSLRALDAATGRMLWSVSDPHRGFGPPALDGGLLYCAASRPDHTDSVIAAFDSFSGRTQWVWENVQGCRLSPAASPKTAGEFLYLGTTEHRMGMLAIRHADGHPGWHAEASVQDGPYGLIGPCAVDPETGLVVGTLDRNGTVYAWDTTTGDDRWKFPSGHQWNVSVAIAMGRVYFHVGHHSKRIRCLDLQSGTKLWEREVANTRGQSSPLSIARGLVVCRTPYQQLVALDALTGANVWRANLDTGEGHPLICGSVVYCTTRGTLHAFALENGIELGKVDALDGSLVPTPKGLFIRAHETGDVLFFQAG